MSESYSLTTLERLNEILESIQLIKEWSCNINNPDDFLSSSNNVMAFNACVMRLQVIGENVGKLLKKESDLLSSYTNIPWLAIYDIRNLISHEYSNIDEEIIFSVIKNDLLELEKTIEKIIENIKR
ncbi:MAG: DUF86 domain-containing protein [Prevotella sp.]|nr:DUF86 domain-containing protein [Prevotella sp.]